MANKNHPVFRARIKSLLEERRLTYKEFGQQIHYSEAMIKQWLKKGGRIAEQPALGIIASFFQVDPEYLLGETDFKNTYDKWNQIIGSEHLKQEIVFWEFGISEGLFPDFYSEYEYESFIDYLKHYEERKDLTVKKEDIKVVKSTKNYISENFDTGEITIHAISEADIEKGFQQLIKRGIIAK